MYILIGEGYDLSQTRVGGDFEEYPFEVHVALFTTKEGAIHFAEQFRLKHPKHQSFRAPQVFNRKSRMAQFTSYRVEEHVEEVLEIDPTS